MLCAGSCINPQEPHELLRTVRTMIVHPVSETSTEQTFGGFTRAAVETRLSFPVAGKIHELHIEEGQKVWANDIVATLIPTAMLATFTIMRVSDIGLDQVSLASLIIALGMLVDNAVVVSEAITVYMGEGLNPAEAAGRAGRELWAPLLTSSLTTATGFLPIFLAESLAGEYTTPLFKVVTITLLCSWVIAHTFTLLLCTRYARPDTGDRNRSAFSTRIRRYYARALMGMLRHPRRTVTVAALAFALAVFGFRYVPIMFFPPNDRDDLSKFENLEVFSLRTGKSAPLSQIADIALEWRKGRILRRNGKRTVTAEAGLAEGYAAREIIDHLTPWLNSLEWDPGYSYEIGGTVEESREANQTMLVKIPVAAFVIFVLLILEFNSFRKTLITILTIPLAFIGVVIGLLVMRSYFGFMTFLGVISLSGIVINNRIVLLERIAIERYDNDRSPAEAIVRAAQRRFRLILLTAATTIAGMIPLYIGGGAMWEPMAVAIAFGLLFATVLTLGIVPMLYALLFKVDFTGFRLEHLEDSQGHV